VEGYCFRRIDARDLLSTSQPRRRPYRTCTVDLGLGDTYFADYPLVAYFVPFVFSHLFNRRPAFS
jgi:hypothetical protein